MTASSLPAITGIIVLFPEQITLRKAIGSRNLQPTAELIKRWRGFLNPNPLTNKEMSYSRGLSILHWLSAPTLLGCVGTVLWCQNIPKEDKKRKAEWMWRFAARVMSQIPPPTGTSAVQNMAAKITHALLYGFMMVMPATGIAMGYYGGKGLPFFFTTVPGVDKEHVRGDIAKQAFLIHKNVGTYGKYLIPAHIGAAGLHLARGQNVFLRINPFTTAIKPK